MKRIVLFLGMILMATMTFADPIDLSKAKQLASAFMADKAEQPKLIKRAGRKNAKARNIEQKYQTTSPYYIFSRGEGKGFVIVSGDDALPEVLGYTEKGDFDENNLPPFLTWYLDTYGLMVEAAQASKAPRMAPLLTASDRVDIAPMIQTHWHQSSPYNDKCPTLKSGGRAATGCVATAASQVAFYWHKDLPSETQGSTSSYTYGDQANATTAFPKGTKLKWDLMLNEYGNEPAEYRDAVATLIAVVGGGAGLTYGSSTAGYNNDCRRVYNNILGLTEGTENSKDWGEDYNNYSDEAWSTLLYSDLIKSRPILYSGCNSNGEGHAVVVDGYQAKTGYFHFNLGWGNPGAYDGYFTVARGKSPSWGFNNAWQECVTGVYPKKQNLKASISLPANVYQDCQNSIKVKVENHGTLDYSGIYVFGSSTGKKPTNSSSAQDKETTTVLTNDGKEFVFDMKVKPTTERFFITVTDAKLNVIVQKEVTTIKANTNLALQSIYVDGSTDVQTVAGNAYTVVYNDKATVKADIINKSGKSYDGSMKVNVYCSSDDGATFSLVGNRSTKVSLDENGNGTASFSLSSTSACPIKQDSLYYAAIQLSTTTHEDIDCGTIDTIVRFVLKGSDLQVVSFEDNCVKMTGNWDASAFSLFAKRSAYKTATTFDLTEVKHIANVPVVETNPNALFYVSEDATATGNNIVKGNVCQNLYLTPGFDFAPKADMTALNATLNISQKPSMWYLLTTPCDLKVPEGIIARQIDSHGSSGISSKTTDTLSLAAGHTYLVMATSEYIQELKGENVNVVKSALANVDTAVVGTFVNASTPAKAFLVNDEETQFFDPVDEGTPVEALRGWFCASNVSKRFRAYSNLALDPAYLVLSQTIDNAYNTVDEYKDCVKAEATDSLIKKIHEAEAIFTAREMSNLEVRELAAEMAEMMAEYKTQIVNPGLKEIDFTGYIVNPSFETGKATGWTTDATVKLATQLAYRSVDCDGSYVLYSYKSATSGPELSQTVENLLPGYYRLEAMLGSTDGNIITLFADTLTAEVKANPLGQYYMTKGVIENIRVGEDGKLTIGVAAGTWYKADDFRLIYTGVLEPEREAEDVNQDGVVNSLDVLKIYKFMQTSTGTESGMIEDVNGDGTVNSLDVLKVYKYMQSH